MSCRRGTSCRKRRSCRCWWRRRCRRRCRPYWRRRTRTPPPRTSLPPRRSCHRHRSWRRWWRGSRRTGRTWLRRRRMPTRTCPDCRTDCSRKRPRKRRNSWHRTRGRYRWRRTWSRLARGRSPSDRQYRRRRHRLRPCHPRGPPRPGYRRPCLPCHRLCRQCHRPRRRCHRPRRQCLRLCCYCQGVLFRRIRQPPMRRPKRARPKARFGRGSRGPVKVKVASSAFEPGRGPTFTAAGKKVAFVRQPGARGAGAAEEVGPVGARRLGPVPQSLDADRAIEISIVGDSSGARSGDLVFRLGPLAVTERLLERYCRAEGAARAGVRGRGARRKMRSAALPAAGALMLTHARQKLDAREIDLGAKGPAWKTTRVGGQGLQGGAHVSRQPQLKARSLVQGQLSASRSLPSSPDPAVASQCLARTPVAGAGCRLAAGLARPVAPAAARAWMRPRAVGTQRAGAPDRRWLNGQSVVGRGRHWRTVR